MTFLCLMICKNSLANIGSDHVQDGSSKVANNDGNQNENEDVKAIETGIILLVDQVKWDSTQRYSIIATQRLLR